MLKRFEARGYRNVDCKVELGRLNVIVGPNNCGKTNLMRAIGFAAPLASERKDVSWSDVIRKHGGASMVAWGMEDDWRYNNARIELSWGWDTDGITTHTIRLASAPNGNPVRHGEELTRNEEALTSDADGWETRNTTPVVSGEGGSSFWTFPELLSANLALAIATVSHRSRHLQRFSCADVHTTQVRQVRTQVETDAKLRPDASNLANHLRHLENHPDGLEAVKDALKDVIPGLKRIWVRDADGQALWTELNIKGRAVKLLDVSDGTIMALILATLLFGPEKKSLLMIDEPELNLHPAWQRVISKWLQAPGSVDQILFSTHSSDLLDSLTEGFRAGDVKLLVTDKNHQIRQVEPEELNDRFEEGWELGDLYRMGDPDFGGWPW